jgi:hypothetical protein
MFRKYIEELFYCLSGALFLFFLMELFWNRIVLSYININLVLIVWLIIGIMLLVINRKNG